MRRARRPAAAPPRRTTARAVARRPPRSRSAPPPRTRAGIRTGPLFRPRRRHRPSATRASVRSRRARATTTAGTTSRPPPRRAHGPRTGSRRGTASVPHPRPSSARSRHAREGHTRSAQRANKNRNASIGNIVAPRRNPSTHARFDGEPHPSRCHTPVCTHSTGTPRKDAPGALLEYRRPSAVALSLTQPQRALTPSIAIVPDSTMARVMYTRTFSFGLLICSKYGQTLRYASATQMNTACRRSRDSWRGGTAALDIRKPAGTR